MAYLVLGVSLVAGLFLMGRWLLNTDPKVIMRVVKWVVVGLAILGGLFVLFRGRLDYVLYGATVLLPFLLRWGGVFRALRNAAKAAQGPTPGQSSAVRTRYLAMALDHDTGAMDGEVIAGRQRGRRLAELSQAELSELLAEVEDDPQSVQILEAWMERQGFDPGETAGGASDDDGPMTREKAFEILGLEDGASESEIREAHRRLMMANHPDRGGSSWVAARINQAKDYLISKN